jgi:hypothetical protein
MSKLEIFAALFLVSTVPAAAQTDLPDKAEIVASLWCDTPDQIETVLRSHYVDKVPLETAVAEMNRSSPEACIPARAIVTMGAEVRRFTAGEALLAVREAKVLGVMRGPYAVMMRPQTWYSARMLAELTPL